ncbi:cupin domain-containing protein [Variovorax terrae]|uniref:Cupin domain-containing protein n=1 Tax=Variovorax terrae TaxID=2923278 RepID=A0A9X1VUU9_9BURK|nr:cupin domain-containing protein [Variovorax terrae]MCJ0763690.1 cupin domain-containing protein [Variovorax terrae]
MSTRPHELKAALQLQPHPEGGWYREVFRSPAQVQTADGRGQRSALTAIYFLLEAGQHSRWHRVLSDEVWVHLEGDVLDLWTWDAIKNIATCHLLGPVETHAGVQPQHVVGAGLWQAARPRTGGPGGYTLAACMVGPGFDFADFSMMSPDGPDARQLHRDHPALAVFI